MLFHLITIPLAVIYSSLLEWVIHKYILHGLGKKRKSFFSFHWHAHHNAAKKNNFYDHNYAWAKTGPALRERLGLYGLVLLHTPLVIDAPLFFAAVTLCALYYYRTHKKMHMVPKWGRYFYPWHWDHHMGKDQDCNWGVTIQWVDKLMGTRKPAYMDYDIRDY